jgi:hypothetical protein
MPVAAARILDRVPAETVSWLLEPENPAVAVLTRRTLLHEPDDDATAAVWARRNEYAPVATILDAQHENGSWDVPSRDYQKYRGSLWQIHFLGELHADGDDPRVRLGADYAFSRQPSDGSWSCNGLNQARSIQCLTANVGRALARLGYARDERIARAIGWVVEAQRALGPLVCSAGGSGYTINGYCHMLAPKLLLFLGEVPREVWPDGAEEVRDAAVAALRDKQVFRCLPKGSREFTDLVYSARKGDVEAVRSAWLAKHPTLEYAEKPGWLRFGFPLSYNSDALESLAALVAVGEDPRPEYEPALALVEAAADAQMRWSMRTSFNGKMLADVESKGKPSKWLTLRALQVLEHFSA